MFCDISFLNYLNIFGNGVKNAYINEYGNYLLRNNDIKNRIGPKSPQTNIQSDGGKSEVSRPGGPLQ